jgi:hypothetical protein
MIWLLLLEFYRSGKMEFLNRSIELGRQALGTSDFPNPSRRAGFLFQMGSSIWTRYEMAGANDKDLEETVGLHRQALRIISESSNHVGLWMYVHGLAMVLVLQFRSDGDVGHLEEASQLYHHASDIISAAHPWRPMIISGFAHSLDLRLKETGDIFELNRAIELDGESVAAMHPSAVNYTSSTLQMVSHLCLRFEVLHEDADLQKAITMTEELLRVISDGDVNQIDAINILAKARVLHAIATNNSTDIDLAIEQLLSIKDRLSRSNSRPESLRTLAA